MGQGHLGETPEWKSEKRRLEELQTEESERRGGREQETERAGVEGEGEGTTSPSRTNGAFKLVWEWFPELQGTGWEPALGLLPAFSERKALAT